MNIDEIKTLTDLMISNDLSEIMLRDGDKRIVLRRGRSPVVIPAAVHASHAAPPRSVVPPPVAVPPTETDPSLMKITSPMVGTYYPTPDPESPPFVKIGDRVGPESVVCIIEAMKVFNEIKAEVAGTIETIEVQKGQPVEFGQVLMTVRVGS